MTLKRTLDRLASSVIHEALFWLLLWVMYAVWAGYSPVHPGSTHAEPLFPLVLLGLMAVLFFSGDRAELRLLVMNSGVACILIPGLLGFNIYRLAAGRFPESWMRASVFLSVYAFLLVQAGFLAAAVWHTAYTTRRWRLRPPSWSSRDLFGCVLFIVVAALCGLVFGLFV